LVASWRPGPGNRYAGDEYERQHLALALQNLAKLYSSRTIPLFYAPLYKDFVKQELESDKTQEGSKI